MRTVDFTKKADTDEGRRAEFETFVKEMASAELGTMGLHGAGGDGGLDAFAKRDGSYVGVQAKYYPDGKLTHGRRGEIVESLERACRNWAPLKKFILCLPFEPTFRSAKWLSEHLVEQAQACGVEICFWAGSTLDQLLSKHPHLRRKWGHYCRHRYETGDKGRV